MLISCVVTSAAGRNLGHATYCPEWEAWDLEQARLAEDEDNA